MPKNSKPSGKKGSVSAGFGYNNDQPPSGSGQGDFQGSSSGQFSKSNLQAVNSIPKGK